ncbi:MAG: Rieske 2Fe-2S domain-containing protein [Planctomycetota bacterium]
MADDELSGGHREALPTGVRADEVTERAPRLVKTPAGDLALVRDGDAVVAVDAWCPHLDGPLWEGSSADGQIACPWHGWRYSLATGKCVWAPRGDAEEAEETEIRVLRTRTEADGTLGIELPAD